MRGLRQPHVSHQEHGDSTVALTSQGTCIRVDVSGWVSHDPSFYPDSRCCPSSTMTKVMREGTVYHRVPGQRERRGILAQVVKSAGSCEGRGLLHFPPASILFIWWKSQTWLERMAPLLQAQDPKGGQTWGRIARGLKVLQGCGRGGRAGRG